jgi:hypothetical protein
VPLQSTGGALENKGFTIKADNLLLGAGSFGLNRANDISRLAADINGDLTVRGRERLTVGTVDGTSGIRTTGGDVTLRAVPKLIVDATINTQPGSGGQPAILGKVDKVSLNVAPILGSGDVIRIVSG